MCFPARNYFNTGDEVWMFLIIESFSLSLSLYEGERERLKFVSMWQIKRVAFYIYIIFKKHFLCSEHHVLFTRNLHVCISYKMLKEMC